MRDLEVRSTCADLNVTYTSYSYDANRNCVVDKANTTLALGSTIDS